MPAWLQQLVPAGKTALDATQIDDVIMACKTTRSDAEMLAVVRDIEAGTHGSSDSERDLMSWSEVEEMQAGGLVRFGSHTRRHTRLSNVVSRAALEDEILGSRRELEERLGAAPLTFCYPNGDTSPEAIECVRAGYRGAVTTVSGWNRPGADPFRLRRVGVHDDVSSSRESFVSRLVGIG
jgi:peptidoglycan/xylan/chitin deacetylase (PgdA/CDA1 family)